MKTILALRKENQELINKYPPPFNNYEKKELKEARKTIAYNLMAIKALESSVTTEQMAKDLEKLKHKIQYDLDNYKSWLKHTPQAEYGKDAKRYYTNLCDTHKMKQQIKFLEFILEL